MGKNLPKISVITVCYNCKEVIEDTLLSVLNQDYENIEYIIIDGLSTDGTTEIIKSKIEYIEKNIKFVSEPDHGIYDAMNKGLTKVSGDWIIYMNGGDKFANESVLSSIFNRNEDYKGCGVLYGDIIQKYKGIGSFHRSYSNVGGNEVYGNVCHQATLVRAQLWKKVGFPQLYKISADLASLKRIYNDGCKFQYIPITIAEFDQTDGASAFDFVNCFLEIAKIREVNKFSIEWIVGYSKALLKQLLLNILTKKYFVKIRYHYLKRKLSTPEIKSC